MLDNDDADSQSGQLNFFTLNFCLPFVGSYYVLYGTVTLLDFLGGSTRSIGWRIQYVSF